MAVHVIAALHGAQGRQDADQQLLALRQREPAKIVAIEAQAVEEHASHGHHRPRRLDVARMGQPHARLQALEAGPAPFVLGDDLAVDQKPRHRERAQPVGDLGIARRDLLATAPQEQDLLPIPPAQRAHPVVLDLEAPVGPRGGPLGQGRQGQRHFSRRHVPRRRLQGPHPFPERRQGPRHVAHLLDRQAGDHGLGIPIDRLADGGRVIVLLEKEPLLVLLPHSHQRPTAAQLEPEQLQLQLAALVLVEWVLGLERAEPTPVPHDDRSRAIVPRRDHSLEIPVFERVVFDVDGQSLLLDMGRGPLGHRPALQGAVQLQPQVVVHVPGPVLLDDETGAGRGGDAWCRARFAERLGGPGGVALLPVVLETGAADLVQGVAPRSRPGAPKGGAPKVRYWV